MTKKRIKKYKYPRNYHAVAAHMRNSAGAMKDDRKDVDKNFCRVNIEHTNDDSETIGQYDLPSVWEEFPISVLSQSHPSYKEDPWETKKIKIQEDEMWENYKRMRPGNDDESE